ncbi:hypothetical protein [Clostridium baratii]|uniref:Type 4 fimbrial biogenesis protein PilX N-terminal domain-containing protein n=1 Tax=Clostridium baratii TaxID=1561 RepID=A0A174UY54_9CLOT|nr:hypothetical protein [Clostridium baratii]CUQ27403.1 Uncharacterised protein [Clostridium baratii]
MKRKGSAILTIMVISMLFISISAIVITSIISTMNSNNAEKGYEDLVYAAEGGLETAYSQIKAGNVSSYPSQLNSIYLIDLKTKTVDSVVVNMEKDATDTNKINLESIAYGYSGAKKVVKSSIKITNTNTSPSAKEIFSNSLVAENDIDVESLGDYDMGSTDVAVGGGFNNPGTGGTDPNIKNQKFEAVIFKSNVQKVSQIEADCIEREGFNKLISKATELNINGGTNVINGIGKFRYSKPNGVSYDIILVNTDKLVLKNNNVWPMDEFNKIVICNGDVEIITNSGLQNKLTNSNIFAKNISISKPGSMHIVKAPAQDTAVSDQLNDSELQEIDEILSKYIQNWNSSTGGGPSGGGSGTPGNIEFEDGSFEYD